MDLYKCKSFEDLRRVSGALKADFPDISALSEIATGHLDIDHMAKAMFPADAPVAYPVEPYAVKADGYCLPHCASILAFGHGNDDTEIRARIVTDLIENEELYLNSQYLRKGVNITDRQARQLLGEYAVL